LHNLLKKYPNISTKPKQANLLSNQSMMFLVGINDDSESDINPEARGKKL